MGKLKLLLCSAILAGLVAVAAGQGDGQNVKIEQSWTGRLLEKEKEVLRTSAGQAVHQRAPDVCRTLEGVAHRGESSPNRLQQEAGARQHRGRPQ